MIIQQSKWEFLFCAKSIGITRTLFLSLFRLLLDFFRPLHWRLYCTKCSFRMPPKCNKIRVMLFASDCSQASGAFRCVVGLAKMLRTSSHIDVFIITGRHGDGEVLLREYNIPYFCVPSGGWAIKLSDNAIKESWEIIASMLRSHFAIRQLRKLIKVLDVDIIHCNTIFSFEAGMAAALENKPYIWHVREYITAGIKAKLVNEKMGFEVINKANRIITVSDWVCKKYDNKLNCNNVNVIHDGVDVERFYRPNHVICKDKIVTFISVGSYRLYKGYDELAKACVKLYQDGVQNFRIWFVGGGLEENLHHYFDEAEINNVVTFMGFQKEPIKYQEQSDIAFTCCRAEAFGLVTVEAMLAGCCVIGARAAATPELIRHGETGLLFDFQEGECPDLVKKMRFAVEHQEEVRRMAKAGQEEMLRTKTLQINAQKVAEIYQEVYNGR